MTLEAIAVNENHLLFAYSSRDRDHIMVLVDRCNYLLQLVISKTATAQEHDEHFALKWMLKQLLEKENLIRVNK